MWGFVSLLAVTGQKRRSSGLRNFVRFCIQYRNTSSATCGLDRPTCSLANFTACD